MKPKQPLSMFLPYIVDTICIYERIEEGGFQDLYKGDPKNVPGPLLARDVRLIGAAKKGIVDIEVFTIYQ